MSTKMMGSQSAQVRREMETEDPPRPHGSSTFHRINRLLWMDSSSSRMFTARPTRVVRRVCLWVPRWTLALSQSRGLTRQIIQRSRLAQALRRSISIKG